MPAQARPSHHQPKPRCQELFVPVKLATGDAAIYGKLCMPLVGKPKTVQLLVHGGTYNHLYWDFQEFGGKYSYADAAQRAGYATFAIDRLATGKSTRPPSSQVTYDAQVSTIHQVTQALRKDVGGHKFRNVMYVGHSFGSAYGIGLAAAHPESVDAVILTGNGHALSDLTKQQSQSPEFFHKANNEPRFAHLDSGYTTTVPGVRDKGGLFYDMSKTDPAVVAADETRMKDVMSQYEFSTRPPNLGELSKNIKGVPVLIFVGQQDTHYCGPGANDCTSTRTFYGAEKPYYSGTCLGVAFVQTGHNINLHTNARSSFWKLAGLSYAMLAPYAKKASCALQGGL